MYSQAFIILSTAFLCLFVELPVTTSMTANLFHQWKCEDICRGAYSVTNICVALGEFQIDVESQEYIKMGSKCDTVNVMLENAEGLTPLKKWVGICPINQRKRICVSKAEKPNDILVHIVDSNNNCVPDRIAPNIVPEDIICRGAYSVSDICADLGEFQIDADTPEFIRRESKCQKYNVLLETDKGFIPLPKYVGICAISKRKHICINRGEKPNDILVHTMDSRNNCVPDRIAPDIVKGAVIPQPDYDND